MQVDLLFTPEFREQFAGGVVFEYNTELLNSLAPYPFSEYGPGNFGVGYFSPESCDDIETNCVYNRFPQFETLSAKYGDVDVSDEASLTDAPETGDPPECPSDFAPVSNFEWPSASVEDRSCPGKVFVTCPAVPDECTGLGVPFEAPPTISPQPTVAPTTLAPTTTMAPTTASPTGAPSTDSPTRTEESGANGMQSCVTVVALTWLLAGGWN